MLPPGHASQSAAAAAVLSDRLGALAFTDTTHSTLNPELSYADRALQNFSAAANEAAVLRLYGGIHYPFDNDDGFDQGVCLGTLINTTIVFTP